jgi:CBS domain-containing membrane protein
MNALTDETSPGCVEITSEDLREAMRDLGTYVDISVEDLMTLCTSAVRHARIRIASYIPVKDIMTQNVVTVTKDADIHEVSSLLAEKGISGMPVVDDQRVVIGVITEADVLSMSGLKRGHTIREIIRHLLGEPLPGRGDGSVRDFMSVPAVTVHPDSSVREAAAILDKRRIKRLPVVDEVGHLVGIISRADIVKAMAER